MDTSLDRFRLAINHPDYFFGRSDLISEIVRSPFEVRIILGGRRLGKTSLLNALRWSLLETDNQDRNRALPVLINLQQEQPRSLDNLRYILISRLRETLEDPQQEKNSGFDLQQTYRRFLRQIKGGGVNLFGVSLNVTNPDQERQLIHEDFSQDLLHIIRQLQQHNCQGICFLFDGAEYIVKQKWANDVWSYLRSLKDTHNAAIQPFLGLILSGYRDLKDYQQRVGSPLLNIAEINWLGTLTEAEINSLIFHRCEQERLKVTEKGIKTLTEWAGCHPYLTHQMLNITLENKQSSNSRPFRQLIRDLIRLHRQKDFEAWWDEEQRTYGFGELEQSVYLALMKQRQGTAETLVEQVNLSFGEVEDALVVLAGTGVIRQLNFETYQMGAKLFEQWVIENRKIEIS